MKDWTVKQVENAKPGRHRVSQSLYLFVGPDRVSRRWIFRYPKPGGGRVTEMGLGSTDIVTLAQARDRVLEARRMVAQGLDPIEQTQNSRKSKLTFVEAAEQYIAVVERTHRNPDSTRGVRTQLLTLASALGGRPVSDIGSGHIDLALRPLWLRAPVLAKRTLCRCSACAETRQGQRTGSIERC
jgi:hypothetical protein